MVVNFTSTDHSFWQEPLYGGFHPYQKFQHLVPQVKRVYAFLSQRISILLSGKSTKINNSYHIPIKYNPSWHKRMMAIYWFCLGYLNRLLVRKKGALNSFHKAVEYHPSNTRYRTLLANAYIEEQNYDGAISHYNAAVALSPFNEQYHNNLCMAFLKKQDLDLAINHLETLVKNHSDNHYFYKDLGKIYLQKKAFDQATNAFLRAYQQQPNQQEIMALVPQYLAVDGGRLKAIELLLKCVHAQSNNHSFFDLLIALYFQEGKDHEGFEIFIQATQQKVDLNAKDIEGMWLKWQTFADTPFCKEWQAKRMLCDFVLNETMKNPSDVKKNFAYMHAEAHLKSHPLLKKMEGGEKKMTGPYFLHLLREESSRFGLENFENQLSKTLEYYQKIDLAYHSIRESTKAMTEKDKELRKVKIRDLMDQESQYHLERVLGLQCNQDYFFLTNWYYNLGGAHALAYVIRRQNDGKFTFIIVNTGDGSHNHVSCLKDHKVKYHPFYYVKDIPPSNLCTKAFFEELVQMTRRQKKLKDADEFYKHFIKKIGGRHSRGVDLDSMKDMITPQRSGSCVWSFWLALLRLYQPFNEYKKLIFRMKATSIIAFHQVFKDLYERDQEARVLMEIAVKAYYRRLEKIKAQIGEPSFNQLLSSTMKNEIESILVQFKR